MKEILVVDIGGTKTNVAFVCTEVRPFKILSSHIFLTNSNPERTIQEILSICESENKNFSDMSLSLPGRWDKNGVLQESYFLHEWLDYPFVVNLAKKLKIQNYFWETDVICGALGEYYVLEDKCETLLCVNIGTGVGAALVKDGKPYKSSSKLTLRMQKLVFPFQEELFSGVDLISGGTLLQISNYDSIESLYKDYKRGNANAFDIISRAQFQLAAWLINLFYLFAPDVIILNGGLTYDWEVLAEGAIEIVKEELNDEVKILPSKLKELAPIYGACLNYNQAARRA